MNVINFTIYAIGKRFDNNIFFDFPSFGQTAYILIKLVTIVFKTTNALLRFQGFHLYQQQIDVISTRIRKRSNHLFNMCNAKSATVNKSPN